MSVKPLIVAAALCVAAFPALCEVHVEDAWIRATVPQQRATGAFMKITSDRPVRLVAARSPASPTVEVHEMKMNGSVMTMRPVDGVDVVPGRATELTPGGYHVMLLDLKQQIKAGETVPLTLVFEDKDKKRSSVEVAAKARALGDAGNAMPMSSMSSMPAMPR